MGYNYRRPEQAGENRSMDREIGRRYILTVPRGYGTIRWPLRTTQRRGRVPRAAVHRSRVPRNSSRSLEKTVAEMIGSWGEPVSQCYGILCRWRRRTRQASNRPQGGCVRGRRSEPGQSWWAAHGVGKPLCWALVAGVLGHQQGKRQTTRRGSSVRWDGAVSAGAFDGGGGPGAQQQQIMVESLILAQDQRWRRA
jgi:hypothetical protein